MSGRYVVLTGGVGGAKLVDGLYRLLPPGALTAIVNTADDFIHLGLPVSPDIDTLLYTLSGKADRAQGWGREGESWNFMAALASLGGETWFNLGDGDLALHVLRGAGLAAGETLTTITRRFARSWQLEGIDIVPMTDDRVATWVETAEGALPFQSYFVERRCEPVVQAIRFEGSETARLPEGVGAAIAAADAIFIAPSNPWLSVDPMLAMPAMYAALDATAAPVVAVSPLIGGKAVKGPTAKLMAELGLDPTNRAIADHYRGVIDGLVVQHGDDAPENIRVARTDTLMRTAEDRRRVAQAALNLATELRG